MTEFIHAPHDTAEAEALVQAICQNLSRMAPPVQQSMRYWDRAACGSFARAAKDCYFYQHGHVLGATLRSLANTAIILEHRQATASKS